MWNWFNCYLSGRHDYGMWCEPGAIFLRCVHCGRRSGGWSIDAKSQPTMMAPVAPMTPKPTLTVTPHTAQVLPFNRQAAAR
jgi:hypothetical protein